MQTYDPTENASKAGSDALTTQTEARRKARELNDGGTPDGLVAIAVPVPFGSWGGREDGWTVSYTAVG